VDVSIETINECVVAKMRTRRRKKARQGSRHGKEETKDRGNYLDAPGARLSAQSTVKS
jgi:hypothetical protein